MNTDDNRPRPIGMFDSGVGGLSVLSAIQAVLPSENVIYLADQAHVPYGKRSKLEVKKFSEAITHYLLEQGSKLIVVACNTASAAALYHLREVFPRVSFVGMEPAVKPAAERTETGVVGVLATPATFQGELYASVVERFGSNVVLLQSTCEGLVEEIENGNLDGDKTNKILETALIPMLEKGIDTVILGCTHYPFVFPMIQEIVGDRVRLIDPAPAVARQVSKLLGEGNKENSSPDVGEIHFETTGEKLIFSKLLRKLGYSGEINKLGWDQESKITIR